MHGKTDAVVIGLGTSGTFEGVSTFLKNKNKNIKIIGVGPGFFTKITVEQRIILMN